MTALIGALRVSLSADTAAFQQGMSRAERQAAQSGSRIERSLKGIKSGIAGLAAGISIGAMGALAKEHLDYAASLGEVSQQLGVTTKDLQVFRYAASQVGLTEEELDKALLKLTVTLGQVAAGAKAPTKALNAIGVEAKELAGLDTGEALRVIAEGLEKVPDRAQRAAVEVALFGRTGAKLDTLLAGGRKGIDNLAAAAEKLGLVLSDEQIQRADEASDKYAALQLVLKANIASEVSDNAEAILQLTTSLTNLIIQLVKAAAAYDQFVNGIERKRLESIRDGGWTAFAREDAKRRLAEMDANQIKIDRSAAKDVGGAAGGGIDPFLDPGGGGTTRTSEQAQKDFVAALKKRGVNITSGHRTQAQQDALRRRLGKDAARFSRHTSWQAVDVPLSASDDVLMAAAAEAGLSGFNVKRKPGAKGGAHAHASWAGHGKAGDIESMIEAEERAREEAIQQQRDAMQKQFQFDSELRQSQAEQLRAQQGLTTDYSERATLAFAILDAEKVQHQASLDHAVKMGEITQVQADQLAAEYSKKDALERQAVLADEAAQWAEDFARLEQASFDMQREKLEGEARLARTAAERRDVELRLLDLVYRQEKARLQAVLADERAGYAAQEEARQRLGQLDGRKAQDQEAVRRSTAGPMESYLNSLPQTAAEVNEAFEAVRVNGIQSMIDGLADAAVGARSLADVFKNVAKSIVADLIRIQLQKAVVGALGNIFGAAGGGIWGGGGAMPSTVRVGGGFDNYAKIPGFARGGSGIIQGRQGFDTNLLSLNGMPLAKVSHGERLTVSPDGGGGGGATRVVVDASPLLTARIVQGYQGAAVAGSASAQQSIYRRGRRQIPSGRG